MIYRSVQDRLSCGFDEFSEAVKDYEILPVVQRGKLFGGVMVKGNEIHVGFAEKPTASIRGSIKEVLKPLFEKKGWTYCKYNNIFTKKNMKLVILAGGTGTTTYQWYTTLVNSTVGGVA